jgi:hypothetical protein
MSACEMRWLLGIALMLVGWWLPRQSGQTRFRISPALPLDLLVPVVEFTLALLLSARPILAGVVTLMLGVGWAQGNHHKRRVLAEPTLFTDVFQSFDILRHPQLAVPFPHKAPVVLATLATLAFFAMVIGLEPRAWQGLYWLAPLFCMAMVIFVLLGRELLPMLYRGFRQRALSAEPLQDVAQHGLLATMLLYGMFARSERAALRAPLRPPVDARLRSENKALECGPVVLVQNESFFDARRLHPGIATGLLPQFDAGCRDGLQWGRFEVPSWGANTVRTEFAVLTGLPRMPSGLIASTPITALPMLPSTPWPGSCVPRATTPSACIRLTAAFTAATRSCPIWALPSSLAKSALPAPAVSTVLSRILMLRALPPRSSVSMAPRYFCSSSPWKTTALGTVHPSSRWRAYKACRWMTGSVWH